MLSRPCVRSFLPQPLQLIPQPTDDFLTHLPAEPGLVHAGEPVGVDGMLFAPEFAGAFHHARAQHLCHMRHFLGAREIKLVAAFLEDPERVALARHGRRKGRVEPRGSVEGAVQRAVDKAADRREHRLCAILQPEPQGVTPSPRA